MFKKVIVLLSAAVVMAGCTRASNSSPASPTSHSSEPASPAASSAGVDPANFVALIDNPFYPLPPGTTFVYEGPKDGEVQRDEVVVTHETKLILGVMCVVVKDTVTQDGVLIEDTLDWFAQDKDGNVWYFGEDTKEYEDGKVVSTAGSWEAGVNGAVPGIIMEANPDVPSSYRQEYYKGEAEDMAWVVSGDESVSVSYGSFGDALLTVEWTPLEPKVFAEKFYAKGVGLVLSVSIAGEKERSELISLTTGQ